MITNIKSEKLLIISDLHLGNPYSKCTEKVVDFLKWAARKNCDVCINGDGIEIVQASFQKLSREVPQVIRALKEFKDKGRSLYYVVGNHDLALEHFLEDWGTLIVSPFLNLSSGSKRIRIEHGHLYDPFFVRNPILYEAMTHFAGFFLKIHPSLYKVWISFERYRAKVRAKKTGIVGEHPNFREAAFELSRRGFDSIIFGHTHHAGQVMLPDSATYLNCGSWLVKSSYIEIIKGEVSLKTWSGEEFLELQSPEVQETAPEKLAA